MSPPHDKDSSDSLHLPSVWRQQSVDVMTKSLKLRSSMQEYRAAYWKYNEDVRRSQYSMQLQVNDALKKKKGTLEMLIDKLSYTHSAAIPVLKTLNDMKDVLNAELDDKGRLLNKNSERLKIRSKRPPPELVADNAQKQLVSQEALLKDAVAQQQKNLKEVEDTITELEAAQQEIKIDIDDKTTALELNVKSETECATPTLKLPSIKCKRMEHNGAVNLDKDVEVKVDKLSDPILMSPNIWHGSTMSNVEKNRKIQTRALALCDGCEMISKKLKEAIATADKWVCQSLEERLKELSQMLDELKDQHRLTEEEIAEAETTAEMLKQALEDIKEPLRVSETRKTIHKQRPEREMIEDDVQIHLKNEMGELMEQNAYLQERKKKVDRLLSELTNTREQLNLDMSMKSKCIELDEQCLHVGANE
mmetsp:Transcript_20985/g.25200  ORF Transcript_20985/g.25200 Transcript_20985/m.25200 type:complete len:420 (+) Transcript_20985:174-1433(+)|eukprot:CAMPEP_0197849384 /NCGR_PEP_ID=MMETSP1438-20131217/11867_1 /TAXON_ID=1461541 /ORGANISM="Pterosperma sp., Strain CCMP1384" /LENGTH=419 /DNA_ID=CAMNT_0043462047 /DNA_START=159 /DNA_END=1418 /DNA_ORIENTATION=+